MNSGALWTFDRIGDHIAAGLPLFRLFRFALAEATDACARIAIADGEHVARPGGSIAGPILFAAADVAAYALILAARGDPDAVTVDLTINFLRPGRALPLIAEATPLRSGRRLFTAGVLIAETDGRQRLIAQATATYALSGAV